MGPLERRKKIIKILSKKQSPISGSELASILNVSRQIIVQDIALLRAEGNEIIATPQGYLNYSRISKRYKKTIVSKHTKDNIKDELMIIIEEGGTILDVIIEHDIYGQISGNIMVSSKREVEEFLDKINSENVKPLSILTSGIHLHTIEYKYPEQIEIIEKRLFEKGYLLK